MIQSLLKFIKHPVYQEDENTDLRYRFNIFIRLLGLSLGISILLGMLIAGIETLGAVDLGEHAMDLMVEQYSTGFIFLAAVVLAPLLEEFFFRGPMVFFQNKRYFKFIFYLLTLVFGFYHITNFEVTPTVLALSPILVAPQISVGLFLGFIRVRFGLLWAMLLHACYNLLLVGPVILLMALDIPLE